MFSTEHWRQRARQIRASAESMLESAAKAMVLEVADQLDRLARRAEGRPKD
jgi:hypothetical protein